MAVESVLVGLQASFGDGRGVSAKDFLAPLEIGELDRVETTCADGGPWSAGMVYFPITRLSEFATEAEPHEAFFAAVRRALLAAADFLDRRPPDVIGRLRSAGMSLRLFLDVQMDQDQMELELPTELVAACGRQRLGVFVISNDIPAAEVLERKLTEV